MDDDTHEVLGDALDTRHKSAEGAYEDLQEAFNQIPRDQLEHAAAVCRDLGNEAVKAGKHEEAAEHYTSVLAAFPSDHEVLCNRALCYLSVGEQKGGERMDEYFQLALQDAALSVNLKPTWVKGLYRLGCALQKCKQVCVPPTTAVGPSLPPTHRWHPHVASPALLVSAHTRACLLCLPRLSLPVEGLSRRVHQGVRAGARQRRGERAADPGACDATNPPPPPPSLPPLVTRGIYPPEMTRGRRVRCFKWYSMSSASPILIGCPRCVISPHLPASPLLL